jgi:hypothetical protein
MPVEEITAPRCAEAPNLRATGCKLIGGQPGAPDDRSMEQERTSQFIRRPRPPLLRFLMPSLLLLLLRLLLLPLAVVAGFYWYVTGGFLWVRHRRPHDVDR